MPAGGLLAYIDESGGRARTPSSTDHFVMSAVVFPRERQQDAHDLLAELRTAAGRGVGHLLHWHKIRKHEQRLAVAELIGDTPWLTLSSVVVCKRHLPPAQLNDDQSYLLTFRYLLERLSWFARDRNEVLTYTLAHIIRFQLHKLREYEARLQGQSTSIEWNALDPHGGYMDRPQKVELLQIADSVASATATAFESTNKPAEPCYLQALAPRLYTRGSTPAPSYGLKMHPWCSTTKAAYPWVAAL